MLPVNETLEKKINQRKDNNSFRSLTTTHNIIDFCSNDYLGFSKSADLKDKYLRYCKNFDNISYVGATGSRLISGNTALIESLENFIASYHGADSGLMFNSGYDANLGLLSSVPQRGDTVYYDALVHASIRDGIRLGFAKAYSFKHNDLDDLKKKLKIAKGNIYVVVESVYSMDGDCAPLKELVSFCLENNVFLIVDEAHATGVFGIGGKGLLAELGLASKVFARVHTFGKALGCHGAIILGDNILRTYLINFAKTFIYTTALPFHSYIAIKSSYDLLNESEDTILELHENIKLFKENLTIEHLPSLKSKYIESSSPIHCFLSENNEDAKLKAKQLSIKGFDVKAILSPTVPKGQERLRICLHSFNTNDEIIALAKSIKEIYN